MLCKVCYVCTYLFDFNKKKNLWEKKADAWVLMQWCDGSTKDSALRVLSGRTSSGPSSTENLPCLLQTPSIRKEITPPCFHSLSQWT